MATTDELAALRRLTDGAAGYTDQQLNDMFNSGMTETSIAHRIWTEKAGTYSALVDTSESGSTRKFSDLHKNALTMAATFAPVADTIDDGTPVKRTRRMVRG